MVSQLQPIVNYMLESLKSTEGVKVHYTAEDNPALAHFELDDTAEEDDDEDFAG